MRVVAAQHAEVHRELNHLREALGGVRAPIVLLKGAAYVAAGLPAAQGRVFADVDLMVPKAALADAESALMLAGWLTTHHNAYDQRYYREWMHELPPMEHLHRGTTLDLHHTILPATSRTRVDANALFAAAQPVPGMPGWHVLSPVDMVLHAMTHLFMNDDMAHALRDLSDLDLLMRHFSNSDPGFWTGLVDRAQRLGLARLLAYGVECSRSLLATPVPHACIEACRRHEPSWPLSALMRSIWFASVRSPSPADMPLGGRLAHGALYVRGHYLKMPLPLLIRHLTVKALRLHERAPAPTDGREGAAA